MRNKDADSSCDNGTGENLIKRIETLLLHHFQLHGILMKKVIVFA